MTRFLLYITYSAFEVKRLKNGYKLQSLTSGKFKVDIDVCYTYASTKLT